MYPLKHLLISVPFIIIFFPIYKYFTLLILVSSYLIDFDHYMWYAAKYKDFNLKRGIKKSIEESGKGYNVIHIFHTLEFIIIITLICLHFKFLFPLIIGLGLHFLLDFIELIYYKKYNDRIISFIELIV
jgi:hypothetical protein